MPYEEIRIDVSWLIYVGCCLLGFDEKKVWRMTIKRINTFYEYYQNDYDFKLCRTPYKELRERRKKALNGELTPD